HRQRRRPRHHQHLLGWNGSAHRVRHRVEHRQAARGGLAEAGTRARLRRARVTIADRFFDAIACGDLSTVESMYSPEVTVWHNYDDVEQTREQTLRTLSYLMPP